MNKDSERKNFVVSYLANSPALLVAESDFHESDWADSPSSYHEYWRKWGESQLALVKSGCDLLVLRSHYGSKEGSPINPRELLNSYPNLQILLICDLEDQQEEDFFGDQRVFFLHTPPGLEELRSAVREILVFQQESKLLEQKGQSLPGIESHSPIDGWLEVTGPSHPIFLRRFHYWMQSLLNLPLAKVELNRIAHAVREIGWNAIEWGNRCEIKRQLNLSFLCLEDRILLRIENEQIGIEDWYLNSLDSSCPADEQVRRKEQGIRPGGLGLCLVERAMDKVQVNSLGNIVVLEKLFSGSTSESEDADPDPVGCNQQNLTPNPTCEQDAQQDLDEEGVL